MAVLHFLNMPAKESLDVTILIFNYLLKLINRDEARLPRIVEVIEYLFQCELRPLNIPKAHTERWLSGNGIVGYLALKRLQRTYEFIKDFFSGRL